MHTVLDVDTKYKTTLHFKSFTSFHKEVWDLQSSFQLVNSQGWLSWEHFRHPMWNWMTEVLTYDGMGEFFLSSSTVPSVDPVVSGHTEHVNECLVVQNFTFQVILKWQLLFYTVVLLYYTLLLLYCTLFICSIHTLSGRCWTQTIYIQYSVNVNMDLPPRDRNF